jgi:hypothetical protein
MLAFMGLRGGKRFLEYGFFGKKGKSDSRCSYVYY